MGQSLIKAIIFDFDGTLVDSEKAIYQCFQSITNYLVPERIAYAKNILIGPPLRDTASDILGPNNQGQLDKFVKLFIEMHDEHAIENSHPYPGVTETLKKLNAKKIHMAIATNKRHSPTNKLIDYFNWQNFFTSVECSDSQKLIRNKDKMIKDIINKNNVFENSYFLGDTVNDGLGANLNKLSFIRADYGYGSNQDWSKIAITKSFSSIKEIDKIF